MHRRPWLAVVAAVAVLGAGAAACTDSGGGSAADRQPVADAGPAPTVAVPEGEAAQVTQVIDGDTFEVDLGGSQERVRMLGINTPERDECFYEQAADGLADMVEGREVVLVRDVSDTDGYGRLLRYVFVDRVFVNAEQARLGNAVSNRYEPDTSRQAEIDQAEAAARQAERGQWAPDACGAAVTGATGVAIVALEPNPPGPDGDDRNGETVTIANDGPAAVDLGGWLLKDTSSRHRFTFPSGTSLGAGGRVDVHSGCGEDTSSDLFWCDEDPVWSNDGDTAYLQDPAGNTVSTWAY